MIEKHIAGEINQTIFFRKFRFDYRSSDDICPVTSPKTRIILRDIFSDATPKWTHLEKSESSTMV